jgi:hypothetical protein
VPTCETVPCVRELVCPTERGSATTKRACILYKPCPQAFANQTFMQPADVPACAIVSVAVSSAEANRKFWL